MACLKVVGMKALNLLAKILFFAVFSLLASLEVLSSFSEMPTFVCAWEHLCKYFPAERCHCSRRNMVAKLSL